MEIGGFARLGMDSLDSIITRNAFFNDGACNDNNNCRCEQMNDVRRSQWNGVPGVCLNRKWMHEAASAHRHAVAMRLTHRRDHSHLKNVNDSKTIIYFYLISRFIIHMRTSHLTILYYVKLLWVALNRVRARALATRAHISTSFISSSTLCETSERRNV